MNSRIKELALEAGIVLKRPSKSWSKNPDWMKTNPNMPMEKFAELLIQECCDMVNKCMQHNNPNDCLLVLDIKEHFGVEE